MSNLVESLWTPRLGRIENITLRDTTQPTVVKFLGELQAILRHEGAWVSPAQGQCRLKQQSFTNACHMLPMVSLADRME